LQKYSRDIVAQVLSATDIVQLIGAYVELKAAGTARFKARCPFHAEKTPSFIVSRDRQHYHCFGCGKGGDAINFLCEFEGLTFSEALRKLADRASIRLPAMTERDGKEDYLRAQLIEFGKFASTFFKNTLDDVLKGSVARQYLKTRELKPETIKRFGLGYAPDGWSNLLDAARSAGFKEPVAEASGLVRRGDRGIYDFFRNRLMIPIRDVSNNVVAFGGRDLGDGTPKYINSPENALYKKARVLYGLCEGRDAMRREKRAILVEGYFDLMRCFDAGIENVVATCGTALTPEQAGLIHRYVPEVVVVYDADAAGIRAALRGVGMLTDAGLTVRAMTLPDAKDPDDFIRAHGADAFRDLVDGALDFVTFYVRMSRDRLDTIEGRTTVAREIFTILASLNDELRRDEYLKRAARELNLHEWVCQGEFMKFLRDAAGRTTPTEVRTAPSTVATQDDSCFIAALLGNPDLLERAKVELAGIVFVPSALVEVMSALFESTGPDVTQRLTTDEARNLYSAAAIEQLDNAEKAADFVDKRMAALKRDYLKAREQEVQREVSEAAQVKDLDRVRELLQLKAGINRQIENVGVS
jgi:DNA primase